MPLIKRNKEVDSIKESGDSEVDLDLSLIHRKVSVEKVISTGSTLLDLAISGGVTEEGGMPGGMMAEIVGPSGVGKTGVLAEICASVQAKGGEVKFLDPEARLNEEYSRIYGMELEKGNYERPDTVSEMFKLIWEWKPKSNGVINCCATDSLAALSTNIEMDDEDKMGMRRAKEFSEGLRKTCRIIANNNWLLLCSNQIREGPHGHTVPGGQALNFYSSLIIKMNPLFQGSKIIKKTKLDSGAEVEKIVGIRSECVIKKSSIDEPFRSCNLSIIFGYGIDTIRDELDFYKAMTKETLYNCFTKSFKSMDNAIRYVEENALQKQLKERTIGLWREIQDKFIMNRTRKAR